MKLKTLRIQGFKSFADRTTLDFREGVTAIVGSNGCGKSNIADAIRWVLGEQRASVIRGAKMEEAIFQGTSRRRPLNLAEVSLLFDNQDGRVSIPQTELEVTRKVFREGGSEYSLNRTACRLRDIHAILRDTGLGSNAYAIIEATMIEAILSDRAEERRSLFEEAAGIGRYKDSRQAAERRLTAAEADLTRLDDLVAEVDAKVRTLSRQKRKAERYGELRDRRLALEIAVARNELYELGDALTQADGERALIEESLLLLSAERDTAELIVEERRIEAAELGRRQSVLRQSLDSVRSRLHEREREIVVAEERRRNSDQRAGELAREAANLRERASGSGERIAALEEEKRRHESVAREIGERASVKTEESAVIRARVMAEREAADTASRASRAIAHEIAAAQGEKAALERSLSDARSRHDTLSAELAGLAGELALVMDQTELWETQSEEIRDRLDEVTDAARDTKEEVRLFRARESRARDELRIAEDRAVTLVSQVEARDALERSYEGFSPAVAAIMGAPESFPGVHGPLADFIDRSGDPCSFGGIEMFLGPLLQALVVEDFATVRAIRRWFREEWSTGGTLVLLPLEALSAADMTAGAATTGGGAWVDLLLAEAEVIPDDPLTEFIAGRNRIGEAGDVVDLRGVVRLLEREAGQGILSQRAALQQLRADAETASTRRELRAGERDAVRTLLLDAEERQLRAEEELRLVESQLKNIQMDTAAHQGQRSRLSDRRRKVEGDLVVLAGSTQDFSLRLERVELLLKERAADLETAAAAENAARSRLDELQLQWDAFRDEEAEVRVALSGAEADFRDADRRLRAEEQARGATVHRLGRIDVEMADTRRALESLSTSHDDAAREVEDLFRLRDEGVGAIALVDARLAEVDSEVAELNERIRGARRRESEGTERRHELDVQMVEMRSRQALVRERVEAEWGRPWEVLEREVEPVDGEAGSWRQEIRSVAQQIDSLGPVNMLAVEEHAEEDRRLGFLQTQRTDLVTARDNLTAAIRQINRTARESFETTFETVRLNFQRTFQSLFTGGECNLWLADPDDPLESAIDIQASPGGKRTQRIHLLSGGERTLTALALLFALYLVKPSPFCVLDEIDAPLDESNVGRFIQLLDDFKRETQFIVITHNPRTMEAADWVYGVTMEDPGVSSIVGVELVGQWQPGAD
ncbi:MAG: chromosome segregation protein SMC [Gemmatimonadota bacterium]|jgi:chromosome segregation protein|nr:chromosome segregation protein SMC [Gemmatimonadota bacterium]